MASGMRGLDVVCAGAHVKTRKGGHEIDDLQPKGDAMTTPIEVHFHGLDRSETVEERVREKVARLEKHFSRLSYCRVAIDAPHRHAHKKRAYLVKLELGIPSSEPLVVASEDTYNPEHEDVFAALRDAFDIARRRLDNVVDKRRAPAKRERGRRRPSPTEAGEA